MRGREGSREALRLITGGVHSVYGGCRRKRLGGVGGVWVRRCGLLPGNTQGASVGVGSTRDCVGFREGGRETVRGGAVVLHLRAGQG
jgi:hypothetical protein